MAAMPIGPRPARAAAAVASVAPRSRTTCAIPAAASGKSAAVSNSRNAAASQRPPCAAAACSCGTLSVESVGEIRLPTSSASGMPGSATVAVRRRKLRGEMSLLRVEVVRYSPDTVAVEVVDDGDGSGIGDGSGRGLPGLRERVTLLGGEIVAGPRSRGFALRATLPLA